MGCDYYVCEEIIITYSYDGEQKDITISCGGYNGYVYPNYNENFDEKLKKKIDENNTTENLNMNTSLYLSHKDIIMSKIYENVVEKLKIRRQNRIYFVNEYSNITEEKLKNYYEIKSLISKCSIESIMIETTNLINNFKLQKIIDQNFKDIKIISALYKKSASERN